MTPGAILAHRRLRAGEGSSAAAAPVMLVHGWLMDGRVWDPVLAAADVLLAAAEVVVPDLRGVGRSGGGPHPGLDGHADDLLALADALDWPRFVLVGHSMGGLLAQRLALRAPHRVASLGLLAPVPASGVDLGEAGRSYFASLPGDRRRLESFFAEQLVDRGRALWLAQMAAAVDPPVARTMLEAWSGADFADELAQIDTPTWVAAGARDPYLPPEVVQAKVAEPIRGARFSVLAGAGHYPLVDRPMEVAAWAAEMIAS